MEGSSESNSRGLITSGVSARNTDFLPIERITRSANASHNQRFKKDNQNLVGTQKAGEHGSGLPHLERGDVISLREWLEIPERCVDVFECLHIFKQIVEIVNIAHSQGIVVHNVWPSCFVMSSSNHVSIIKSASCSDSGSDSLDDGSNIHKESHRLHLESGSLTREDRISRLTSPSERRNKFLERQSGKVEEEKKQSFSMKQILAKETSWYMSPEEEIGSPNTYASDVYRLGVLLFELLCPASSREEKFRTMSSLKHRVLPTHLLLKWPKEASFCLWLLHPDPNSRPTTDELLESEFLKEPSENLEEREAAIELRDRIEEHELLLEFLLLIQQRKQEAADKLQGTILLLSSDIEEVIKQQLILTKKGTPHTSSKTDDQSTSSQPLLIITGQENPSILVSRKRFRQGIHSSTMEEYDNTLDEELKLDVNGENQESILLQSSRLMRNFKKLESVYFLTRYRQIKDTGKSLGRVSHVSTDGRGSIVVTDRSSISNWASKDESDDPKLGGWINPFLEGLCKYLSFSKLRVRADLQQGDLLNSSNLVCSLGFDRDGEFFATAGVNKKIKIFECDAIINNSRDIHYPVVELESRSKLSGLCWNTYIKSQVVSSNFEGVIQVWDVARSQLLTEMREHEKRVWSIDISSANPTLLASGSDDGSVKLWNINQGTSIGTIKTKANICCVQFQSDSGRSLAFGSADHKVYYYDLRNPKIPLCTMIGHNKTVSYVRFLDSSTLVSSSTDNTLKLWDLSMIASGVNESPLHSFTGHTNVKNFVGLSVSDGYIATGSETNEVFVYHKAFPMPVLSLMFTNTDHVSGLEVDDPSQFISSVCWRGQSSTLVAANSTGNIKILEMV